MFHGFFMLDSSFQLLFFHGESARDSATAESNLPAQRPREIPKSLAGMTRMWVDVEQ